jgi:hypothetical protein
MEKATARITENNAFMVLKASLLTARVRLSNRRHDCAADQRFKFKKRSQYFIRAHDETLSVAMRGHNPDRSPFEI